jgi:hypothetical protein
MNITDVAL